MHGQSIDWYAQYSVHCQIHYTILFSKSQKSAVEQELNV